MLISQIREKFLEFFKKKGHIIDPSSSLVPRNDSSLLFTNAGMVPFKNYFTGQQSSPHPNMVSAQKCVRAGGKHNDLENVGYTARHHTFFEMLGNFSFGGYFKAEAIELAWELLTKEFQLDPKKLYITYYSEDQEAHDIWKKLTNFPAARLIPISTKDNFWSMGPTGPAGPCSEIFYDHGPNVMGGPPGSPDAEGDRFVEIWNLVFMQYDQLASGEHLNLPKPCIDTGMGLERMGAVLSGSFDNYDTDILRSLIEASAEVTHSDPDGDHTVSHRVIADHLRAICFLMADGVMPANEGRGYVLRRIMRRAMRHAHLTGYNDLLLHQLVAPLNQKMGQQYPELLRAEKLTKETLYHEENRFKATLDRGLKLLEEETQALTKGKQLSGDTAFKLYDTYGFPLDLTQDALRAKEIGVDTLRFDELMKEQKTKARAAWKGSGDSNADKIWFDVREKIGPTEFLGYETEVGEGKVLALLRCKDDCLVAVEALHEGSQGYVLTNQTPFYAQSGGQQGDKGVLFKTGVNISIIDTAKRAEDLHAHYCLVQEGTVKLGDVLEMRVDEEQRQALRCNHSATHLLHQALRDVLGEGVVQKGSLVAPDRLRFDFSLPRAMRHEEIEKVEDEVNRFIRQNSATYTVLMSPKEAIAKGAMALFGEKYGEEVRIVSMGIENTNTNKPYSKELCGGTHVKATGEIGYFKILSESSVAAGIRRIEAVTAAGAHHWIRHQDKTLQSLAQQLKTTPEKVIERTTGLMMRNKELEKTVKLLKSEGVAGGKGASEKREKIGAVMLITSTFSDMPMNELRAHMDKAKKENQQACILFTGVHEGKVSAILGVTEDLKDTFPANQYIKDIAEALGGKGGGGRADMAQCGGADPTKIPSAQEVLRAAIAADMKKQ